MGDTLTKARGMTKAESFTKHEQRIRPGPEIPPSIAEPAPQAEQSSTATANDDDDKSVVILGSQHTRKYSAQQRTTKASALSCVWVYDTESNLAYKLDYDDIEVVVWDYRHPNALIIEHRRRHVGVEGERLETLVEQLDARRVGELSAAARPEFDPKIEGKPHLRGVVVRLPGDTMRIKDGKLDVRPEWDDEQPDALALKEANA